ncbi:MAG: hypothetical protein LBV71_12830 [Prevotella sp.]|nr:hypothetical protein [Prevotella sp.]
MSEASNFISKRKQPLSLRQKNIQNILWYMLECYSIILNEGKTYSLSDIKKSNVKPENYLRNKLVDEYLRKYTHLFKEKFKTEYIFFDKDTEETYIDEKGSESTDKIDIYIRNKALQDYWSNKPNVYYAVECKRIKELSDTQKYINEDTVGKFIERKHTEFRQPIEGQLAFIENSDISPLNIVDDINKKLCKNTNTESLLSSIEVHEMQKCCFISKHNRSFNIKSKFSIYHLLLDYSDIVIN